MERNHWTRVAESPPERNETLKQLQSTFTSLLSADYQMSKLLPYGGHTAQPSSKYYLQKVSYDIYGIVDHRDESGHLYLLNETVGPKNTDHSFSYLLYYLKSSGKVPSWVRRVHTFMDNAGSTNKNQFMMAATLEVLQRNILDYFWISFMVEYYEGRKGYGVQLTVYYLELATRNDQRVVR